RGLSERDSANRDSGPRRDINPGPLLPEHLRMDRPMGPMPRGQRPVDEPPTENRSDSAMNSSPDDNIQRRPHLQPHPGGQMNQDAYVEFVVWNSRGQILVCDGDLLTPRLTKQAPPLNRGVASEVVFERNYVQAVRRGPNNTTIATIRSTEAEFARVREFGFQMGAIGLTLLVVGLFGGWWISGRIVQPIAEMAATASGISANRLAMRIDVARLDAELMPLGGVLNQAFERLQKSFERLTQFTADASHELRTPLAVIQSQIELTLSRPRSAEDYRQTLQTCIASTHRLQSMVDGLLLLARADAERLDLAQQTVDLRIIAEDVCVQLQEKARQLDISLECATPEEPVFVRGDASFLARVPFNLVDNSIQHTPHGGQIHIEVLSAPPHATLTVTDHGPGIPAEHQAHLFDRFYRADVARSRRHGGSGLGLAICKSIVEAHGGTIECQSRVGQGATFVVQLPLRETGASENTHGPSEAEHTQTG
ncbi:MAG: ATP-binding protein, partial [Planctomycetaceae bacterium]